MNESINNTNNEATIDSTAEEVKEETSMNEKKFKIKLPQLSNAQKVIGVSGGILTVGAAIAKKPLTAAASAAATIIAINKDEVTDYLFSGFKKKEQ